MYCSQVVYLCRYVDMVPLFGRSLPQFSMIFNQTIDLIDSNHNLRLSDLNQDLLNPRSLQAFAVSVYK